MYYTLRESENHLKKIMLRLHASSNFYDFDYKKNNKNIVRERCPTGYK
jgi:hypothetical protein